MTIQVFDLLGNEVININSSNKSLEINTSHLTNGVYFFKISSSGRELGNGKMIKH